MYIVIEKTTEISYIFKEAKQVCHLIGCNRNTISNNKHKTKYEYKDYAIYFPINKLIKSSRGGLRKKFNEY